MTRLSNQLIGASRAEPEPDERHGGTGRAERHGRVPDARPGLDALRTARLPRLQGRDEEALPRLQGALPERQRRRVDAAAAVQLGDRAGRQGDRARPGGFDRRRLAGPHGAEPGHQGDRLRPAGPVDAGRLLRVVRQRRHRQGDRAVAGPAPEGHGRADRQGRRARGQRLADRRGGGPDQEGHPRRAARAAATRRWPSTTRPTGRRRRRSSGSAGRSPASARRSSASSPPTTARAAARSRPSRRPASTRCRRSPATTRRSRGCS